MSLDALTEVSDVRQIAREPRRRWFRSSNEDLIVWYTSDDSILGFQLCYDRQGNERALSWRAERGYSHEKVDDGEAVGLSHKQTPILVPDGAFDSKGVLDGFLAAANSLPSDIVAFVAAKLREYVVSGKDT